MPDKPKEDEPKDPPGWAGKGFSKRNEESAPDPEDEEWVWQ